MAFGEVLPAADARLKGAESWRFSADLTPCTWATRFPEGGQEGAP